MLKVILSWLTACILALNTATTALAQSPQVPRFEPTDCPFAIPRDETIRCGFLIVPEDRSLNSGPTIKIGVAIVASHSPHPAPDPIFFLNGGPGGSMTILFPDLFLTFKPYLTTRDVVLFDQRGAGWSQPALNCPETASLEMDKVLGKRPGPEEALKPYLACRDRLIDAGVNLPAYNTIENAADVKDLRDALGYDRINLLGVSYGTLLGQVLARDYPHMIRSAILDSAYPLWETVMADSGASMMHYFDIVFANCAADTICRTLYPDLPKVFAELYDRFARVPLTVSDQNPLTGQTYTFTLDNMLLIQLLVHASPDEVPALLSDLRDGDFETARLA
ncbi:MAG TPA: alpha/beta fold hydrolase, partial [Anaerolineae bacterium]